MSDYIIFRSEQVGDEEGIFGVHQSAFPSSAEGKLVDELRSSGRLLISCVAVVEEQIVGHIGFSPVVVGSTHGLGLAPLAVMPEFQRRGIGTGLVKAGLSDRQKYQSGFVVVLGEPRFYQRFGFQPASLWLLKDEYGGGDEFQALELRPGSIPKDGGTVRYSPEFAKLA